MTLRAEKVRRLPQRPRAAEILLGRHWYIRPDAGQALRAVVEKFDPAALTAWADTPAPESIVGVTIRDGIATVPVNGPMERTWGFWSWLFGSPTYEMLAVELHRLRDNAAVRATVLAFDTPGGMVNGCGELAGIIRAVDDVKPVFAHAVGDCCSAGYYLASASRRIFSDRAAIVGSIGTCATFLDTSGWEEQLGIEFIEMVSTQSPRKNADPTTEAGRADWQALLDSLAAVFITDVAAYRGVDEATVLEDFGQGGVFVGQEAIEAGLADALGTHDSVHDAVLTLLDSPEKETAMPAATRTRASTKPGAPIPATARRTRAEADDPEKDDDEPAAENDETPDDDEEEEPEEQDDENVDAMVSFTFPMGYTAEQQAEAFAAAHPDAARVLSTRGAAQERERVLGIHGLAAKVNGHPKAMKAIADGMKDPKATRASVSESLLDGGVLAGASVLAGREQDEAELDPPSNADGAATARSDQDRAVQAILTAGKPAKPAK